MAVKLAHKPAEAGVDWEALAARRDALRLRKNALLTTLLVFTLLAVITYKGASTISWEFLTTPPP